MPTSRDELGESTRTGRPRRARLDSGSNEPTPTIQPAEKVGRFQVLGCIGMGGMGQVYAAYDPKLNRQVALKVLHEDRNRDEDPRLVREAQALARLSHPNVVAVHDVGTHDERLFVAMEYVQGVTLRDWMRKHPPGSAERFSAVLDHLLQAGEGLVAAHRARLVHRDFKPGNVLIGDDGRARVVDFGLVRVEQRGSGTTGRGQLKLFGEGGELDDDLAELLHGHPLTQPGAILGTPAYMAPEQFLMTMVDASSDQFAFCLTAWEAIFGVRPFLGKSIPALLEAIRGGKPVRPLGVECPGVIEGALRKGMAFGPSRRHADMEALLGTLRSSRVPRDEADLVPLSRRRLWLGALLLTGTTATTALALGRDEPRPCMGAERHIAGIWDEGVAARLESAFLRTGATFAPDAWDRFERGLDSYSQEWIAGHRDACEAAQVRKEQSTELMDQRMACLNTRRQVLAATTEVYAQPNREMLARADEAIAALVSVGSCANPEYVSHQGVLPESAEQATQVEGLQQSIAMSSVHEAAGRYAQALALADEAVVIADELGLPVPRARAYLRRGKVHVRLREEEQATDDLERAYLMAELSELPAVAFEASRALIQVHAVLRHDFTMAHWWARAAKHRAEGVGDAKALAQLHIDLGSMQHVEGRFAGAAKSYEHAVELLHREIGPVNQAYAAALGALGDLRLIHGGPEQALPLLEEALATSMGLLGPDHPAMARYHTSISKAHRLSGDLDQALHHIQRAMVLGEEAFGVDHVALQNTLAELSRVRGDRGETEVAIAVLERARGLHVPEPLNDTILAQLFAREGEICFQSHAFDRAEEVYRNAVELASIALGEVHPDTARYRISLGAAIGAVGRRQEGHAIIEAGLASYTAVLDGEDPNIAQTYDMLAAEMERSGELDKALEYTEHSLRISEATYGANGLPLVRTHGNMCAVLGQLGRVREAVEHCQQAIESVETTVSFDPLLIAGLHNNLGAALVNAGRHEDAMVHYESAKAVWEERLGPRDVSVAIALANLAEIDLVGGRYDEAYERYSESLAIRQERLGPDHPMVAVPREGMAKVEVIRSRARGR